MPATRTPAPRAQLAEPPAAVRPSSAAVAAKPRPTAARRTGWTGVRLWLVLLWLIAALAPRVEADVVHLKKTSGRSKLEGDIVDFTGRQLTLQTSGGRTEQIDTQRIERVETQWLAAHEAADELFQAGRFDEALDAYRAAARQEERRWVRRKILASEVWCCQALDRLDEAAASFVVLVNDDASTQYFSAIPLIWTPRRLSSAEQSRARRWLDSDAPVQRLIAASWLLASDRQRAAEQLRRLSDHGDPRIVALAESQLWRREMARPDAQRLDQWHQKVEQMPEDLRAGPWLLIGRGLVQLERFQEAAIALMRVPILYPQHRQLAAASLDAAARALERGGYGSQAEIVRRELATDYADTQPARDAGTRIDVPQQ